MAGIIYALCALTAFLCAFLLLYAYRQSKYKLLLWGALCFAGLTLSNAILVIDKLVVPMDDLSTLRYIISLLSMLVLLYGLIWDTE
ncbi:MAG: hypothetical protein Dbin4_02084 [Alphaproteobacteria bacterium]|nr:hypothetical protein [Alphaproteobacteria bacterium]